jgi:hypothetical protein
MVVVIDNLGGFPAVGISGYGPQHIDVVAVNVDRNPAITQHGKTGCFTACGAAGKRASQR